MLSDMNISQSMKIKLDDKLPEKKTFQEGIRRAPTRGFRLNKQQTEVSLRNALRYIPEKHHSVLIPEFLQELKNFGRIYGRGRRNRHKGFSS